jgi:CheY-like chemotaxis protein
MLLLEVILIVVVISLIYIVIVQWRKISEFKKKIEELEAELVKRPIAYEKPKPVEIEKPKKKIKKKPIEKPKPPKKIIPKGGKKKIVMVEDDPFIRKIFTQKFEEVGFEIKTFDVGSKEVIEKIAQEDPDIISMDIILPGLNGIELTKLLKKDERTKYIPIIALGILEEESMIQEAIEAGMEDYYVKAGQTPSEYVKAIDRFLKNPRGYKRNYKKLLKRKE